MRHSGQAGPRRGGATGADAIAALEAAEQAGAAIRMGEGTGQ